jgi:hypothetical protein
MVTWGMVDPVEVRQIIKVISDIGVSTKAGEAQVRAALAGTGVPFSLGRADGPTVFAHACKMGLEGVVSKRKASGYRSGRSPDWLKSKNPACAAVQREAEEDWGR